MLSQPSQYSNSQYSKLEMLAPTGSAGLPVAPDSLPLPGSATGAPPLFTSLPVFDRLTGGFRAGEIALLQGDPSSLVHVAWRLCVRAVADFGWPVALVDGGNLSNVRGLLPVCRQLGVHRDLVLPRIELARAFTAYQMTTLMVRDLPRIVKGPCLILILAPDFMYSDPDLDPPEARFLLEHSLQKLGQLTRASGAVTVMVSAAHPARGSPFARLVAKAASSQVAVEVQGSGLVLDTGAHRVRWKPVPPGQRILDAYGLGGGW